MADQEHREIEFTIDGRPFHTEEARQTADSLLRLAGLDPANYDLAELSPGDPEPHRFRGHEEVRITPGARFVSIRHHADVA